ALAAAVGAVEHRVVLLAQVWGALDRHAADDDVARFADLLAREAEVLEQREGTVSLARGSCRTRVRSNLFGGTEALEGVLADDPRRESAVKVEYARDGRLHAGHVSVGEALLLEAAPVDVRCSEQRVRAGHVRHDLLHLALGVPESPQRARHRLVDDLEVS